MDQAVDHEGGGDVDAVLAGVFAMPFELTVELGIGEGVSEGKAGVALDAGDDVGRRCVHVGAGGVAGEFELLAMRGHREQDGFRGLPPVRQGGGGKHGAGDDAREQVPGLGVQADFQGDAVFANKGEKPVELHQGFDREGAGGFEKGLEHARAVAPGERGGMPGLGHLVGPFADRV